MSKRWGATPEEWDYLVHLGLCDDLLPVVSNQQAQISPQSKIKGVGKTPSRYYGAERLVGGISKWTDIETTPAQVKAWSREPDYGICIQTRRVRGLDIDIPEPDLADAVAALFTKLLGRSFPTRYRANSGKRLLAFVLPGDLGKRSFKTKTGLVEFLATGQQFIAVGTHTSGVRYEWDTFSEMPELVELGLEAFEDAWNALVVAFSCEPERRSERRVGGGVGVAPGQDDVADWLGEHYESYGVQDGKLFVACPWKDGHSGDSGETEAAWLIAGTGGYAQGHFECLHASCAGRKDADFLEASGYSASLFDDLTTAEEKELTALYVAERERSARQTGGQLQAPVSPRTAKLPLPGFKRNNSGAIEPVLENVIRAAEHAEACGYHLRFDTFRAELMIAEAGTDGWRPFVDADGVELRRQLERIGFKPVGKELMRDAVELVARDRQFDTAAAWLESLRPWDGVSRVAGFMHRYMGWADTPYSRACGRYAWTAHAGRIMDPGCKVDMAVILAGPQGYLKSSAIAAISPAPDFFAEFDMAERDADMSRLMRGTLVGELGELRGMNTKDADSIKAWMVRQHEKWTPKFKEYGTTFPRRLVFWGSTNATDEGFLADPTGERRWLPGVCVTPCDPEAVAADRDQLWAEALALWREQGVLWAEAERLGREEHDQFRVSDSWEPLVERWLDDEDIAGDTPRMRPYLQMVDVANALGLDMRNVSRREEMRIGKVLRALGYVGVQRREGRYKLRVWVAGVEHPASSLYHPASSLYHPRTI